jgi:glycine/D-amino acid oxidase-like deaminating enzyme
MSADSPSSEAVLDVAILGAGVQGLTLAARLEEHKAQTRPLSYMVFESARKTEPGAAIYKSAGQLHARVSMPFALFRSVQEQEFQRQGWPVEQAKEEALRRARVLARLAAEGCHDFRSAVSRYGAEIYPGAMHVACTAQDAAAMREEVEALTMDYGQNARYLQRAQVLERIGIKRKRYFGGVIHNESGFFDPLDLYPKLLKGLEESGARMLFDCKVTEVQEEGEYLRVVTRKHGSFLAKHVIAANVTGDKINPHIIKRKLRYAAYVFTARQPPGMGVLPQGGAFDEEADPFLFVTRIKDRLMFGYADTSEKQGEEGLARLQTKAAVRVQRMAKWLEDAFDEQIIKGSTRTAMLHVTGSGLPDVSESMGGRLITSTGLSGIGHNVGALISRLIADRLVEAKHHYGFTAEDDYLFLRDTLPKGDDLTPQKRVAYVDKYLAPTEAIPLSARTPGLSCHI